MNCITLIKPQSTLRWICAPGSTDFNVDDYLNNDRYETIYYKAFQIAVFRDLQYNDEK